jgi:hypothetical protein
MEERARSDRTICFFLKPQNSKQTQQTKHSNINPKMIRKFAIAVILVGIAFGNLPPPPPLFPNVARQFNTFVEGRFECHGSETLGRLGAGGNINISSYAVACGLLNPFTSNLFLSHVLRLTLH